jgi:chromosome segregation ATPase
LANQIANGIKDILSSDQVDIEQHIDFNRSGMEKLQKMLMQHRELKDKQGEIFGSQVKTKSSMKDQIHHLQAEKAATLRKIEQTRKEHQKMLQELQRLKETTEDRDREIGELDGEIDALYDQMEEYEQIIAQKNQ